MRCPSPLRLLTGLAVICGGLGALRAQTGSAALTALLDFGVLGSAASMVAVATAPPTWLSSEDVIGSVLAVARRLAMYCVVAVTFALAGYLAIHSGTTLYKKFL